MINAAVAGSVFWIPAALVAHFGFGRALESAVAAARRGIDAEERAHARVAAIAAAVAGVAWFARDLPHGVASSAGAAPGGADSVAGFATVCFAWSAALLLLVFGRAWDRIDFLRKLEAGPANGYRVEATSTGAIVKKAATEAADYRDAVEEDGLLELDRDGRFVRRL
jgi:hypothetical protein